MVSEEIGLNEHLQAAKIEVVETDLGEYIVQLRGERPSHIIAPVIHLNKETIELEFRRKHERLPRERRLDRAEYLVAEARALLREKFLAADVGITGANLLIAETGSSVIVTNEGNGDLTSTLPRMHIVIASIEKMVPTLEDASTILRLLARSATGQEITTYTTFAHRPAPRGRSRRSNRLSRRPARQWAERDARQRVRRHAALYPLRRLPQSLPGLWRDRRPCLWLDLSRPDGRGADAAARGHRPRARPAQRFELLRTLRGGLPDGHSPPRHDAGLAGARLCARQPAPLRAAHAEALGLRGEAAAPLPCACRGDDAQPRAARGRARAIEPVAADAGLDCRCAISPPRKARPSSSFTHGRCGRTLDERAGGRTLHRHGTHSRLARRGELGPGAQGIGRAPARTPSARHDPCARQAGPRGVRGAVHRDAHRARRRRAAYPDAKRGGGGDRVLSRHLQFAATHPHGPGRGARRAALARRLGHRARRSDRRGRATGPRCRAPSWPRRRPEPCSWCRAPKTRPR